MSNEINDNKEESDTSGSGVLAKASSLAFDVFTGTSIPEPVKKNALKAFGQLCTAVVDIPVAYLEGKAAEKRAETQARVKLISTGGDQIASQMNVDPEYASAAVKKYGEKIVQERINIDKACNVAVNQIQENSTNTTIEKEATTESNTDPDDSSENNSISDDWINTFENEASSKSTEEMQYLFGRILAGEIQKPKSFSIKTLKLVGEIDSSVANLFRRFCSLCIYLKAPDGRLLDARVASLGGNAASNSLKDYGLNFAQLNILQEYGLIISDYNSYFNYQLSIVNEKNEAFPFVYQNRNQALLPETERPNTAELRIHGVTLSRAGMELLSIVDIEPDEKYTSALKEYFNSLNLEMVEI